MLLWVTLYRFRRAASFESATDPEPDQAVQNSGITKKVVARLWFLQEENGENVLKTLFRPLDCCWQKTEKSTSMGP